MSDHGLPLVSVWLCGKRRSLSRVVTKGTARSEALTVARRHAAQSRLATPPRRPGAGTQHYIPPHGTFLRLRCQMCMLPYLRRACTRARDIRRPTVRTAVAGGGTEGGARNGSARTGHGQVGRKTTPACPPKPRCRGRWRTGDRPTHTRHDPATMGYPRGTAHSILAACGQPSPQPCHQGAPV